MSEGWWEWVPGYGYPSGWLLLRRPTAHGHGDTATLTRIRDDLLPRRERRVRRPRRVHLLTRRSR